MKLTPLERARRYTAKCPPAVSGQGGHNATFHVAAVLVHGFALGEADALALLREFNQRCQPPWSEGELIYKINSAAHTVHLQPRGYLLGEDCSGIPYPGARSRAARMTPPPKPKFQKTVLARIAAKVADIKDVVKFLADRSPVPTDRQDSASVLRHLYSKPHRRMSSRCHPAEGELRCWEAQLSCIPIWNCCARVSCNNRPET